MGMTYRQLGQTDLNVSVICLGTMTWGQQNTEAEAHAQMDFAWDRGINFMDAAEMYPVPPKAETQGLTEQYIGTWLASRKNRDKVILATKIAGPSWMKWIRDGKTVYNKQHIQQALDDSLKRLQTDYVDLYQLHWPARKTNFFGSLGYSHLHSVPLAETEGAIETALEALDGFVKAGKIRHIGLSNETPWGTMKFLELAKHRGWPRVVSVQNPYNLLNRTYEIGMSEVSIREQCGLLAYSPLAFGWLSGKYSGGQKPSKGRLVEFDHFDRYDDPRTVAANDRYVALAKEHGLTPTQLALAFVNTRDFVTSNIIGATTLEQLEENIATAEITLKKSVLRAIEAIHLDQPNPAP